MFRVEVEQFPRYYGGITLEEEVALSRSFANMLEATIHHYQNRSLDAAEVITELIELAKQMRGAHQRGEALGLSEEELAFYDALETNDSAVQVLGDETLRTIAHEFVNAVRRNATIDWTVKESARARLRTIVKRLLRKYDYPPDKQEMATRTILEQAELLGWDWAARCLVSYPMSYFAVRHCTMSISTCFGGLLTWLHT